MATGSTSSIEEVAKAGGQLWLQLISAGSQSFVHRGAPPNGYEALVVTVDL